MNNKNEEIEMEYLFNNVLYLIENSGNINYIKEDLIKANLLLKNYIDNYNKMKKAYRKACKLLEYSVVNTTFHSGCIDENDEVGFHMMSEKVMTNKEWENKLLNEQ